MQTPCQPFPLVLTWVLRLVPDDDSSPTQQSGTQRDPLECDEGAARTLDMSLREEQRHQERTQAISRGRAEGKSIAELAAQYQLSPYKVRKALQDAEKEEILRLVEDGTFSVLIPKALAALEKALDQGNLKAVELTLALAGTMKASPKAKASLEVNIPEGKAVGIMALEEIRREKLISPPKDKDDAAIG